MTLHFHSKEDYRKWEAYKHIHGIEGKDEGRIYIGGILHHVHHDEHRRKTHKR